MRIGILGPLQVTAADGRPVDVGGARLRSLLIRLALDAGRTVRVETLADALWGDELPADQTNALQSLVSRLRRALPEPDVLRSEPGGYRLDVDRHAVDAVRFEELTRCGHDSLNRGAAAAAVEELDRAIGLWRGPALADVLESVYAAAPAARLEELRLSATEDRLDAYLNLGRHSDVVGELESLVAEHPQRERLRGQLMKALYATGRQADALTTYDQFRGTLADELGADPSGQLQEIYVAILRSDPELLARTADDQPQTNLPANLTSFVGRDDDIKRLRDQVGKRRLVTLVGPGGTGKTRLAITAASRLLSDSTGHGNGSEPASFAGGVWLAGLASVTDPADVPFAVLDALGLRESNLVDAGQRKAAAHDAMSRLVDALSSGATLIVLDNCEHVINAAADLAEQLLLRCPGLRLLATSREALNIPGETLYPVEPLGVPSADVPAEEMLAYPSVALFADRGADVRPGFSITDDNRRHVIDICRRLDGLPLAIELAAARLRALSPAQISARLDDRFHLLTGGNRTAVPRHQTLQAVVAWSWDLLTDDERRVAEWLSEFPAGSTPESVAGVCGFAPAAALDLLVALVDKSLLQVADETEPRYRMLETIREFGRDRLAAAWSLSTVRSAHAGYFLNLAETAEPVLRTADQLRWMRLLDVERDNLLAALRYAVDVDDADTAVRLAAALGLYWSIKGNHAEAVDWLSRALGVPGSSVPDEVRAVAIGFFVINCAAYGDLTPLAGYFDEIRELASSVDPRHGHPLLAALAPGVAGLADNDAGGMDVIDGLLDHQDPWTRSMLHLMRAAFGENLGRMSGMRDDLTQAADGFRALGERWGLAMSLNQLGELEELVGNLDAARACYTEGLALMRELGAESDIGELRYRLARLADDSKAAKAELLAMLDVSVRRGRSQQIATQCRMALGDLARWDGDLVAAKAWYEEATTALESVGLPGALHQRAIVCAARAMLATELGEHQEARVLLAEAVEAGVESHDFPVMAQVGVGIAHLKAGEGDLALAAELLGAADAVRGIANVASIDVKNLSSRLENELGDGFEIAYARGANLSPDAGVERLRAAVG